MSTEKLEFLFGEVPARLDPDDSSDRQILVERLASVPGLDEFDDPGSELDGFGMPSPGPLERIGPLLDQAIANQILDDDPPETWATAQRLLASGLSRAQVLIQLRMAFLPGVVAAIEHERSEEPDAYLARLDRLPVPGLAAVGEALLDATTRQQGIAIADLVDAVVHDLIGEGGGQADAGADEADLMDEYVAGIVRGLAERLLDEALEDPYGSLGIVHPDRVVNLETLWPDDLVVTHRMEEVQLGLRAMGAALDLAPYKRRFPLVAGEEVQRFGEATGELTWQGPDGWLDGVEPGDLLALHIDADDELRIEVVTSEPPIDPSWTSTVKGAYERLAQDGLPVPVEDIFIQLALDDPTALTVLRPPIGEVFDALGYEHRVNLVATGEEQWEAEDELQTVGRIAMASPDTGAGVAAAAAARVVTDPSASPDDIRSALDALHPSSSPIVGAILLSAVLFPDGEVPATTRSFVERASEVAKRNGHKVTVAWLAALIAESDGDLSAAEEDLIRVLRLEPSHALAADRLAWIRSDRGDVAGALVLLRRLEGDHDRSALHEELLEMEALAAPERADLGRNQPCWCGSGRKYKQCHLGAVEQAALPDRSRWLYRKALEYLARGMRCDSELAGILAEAILEGSGRAIDAEAVEELLEHPVVEDLVLHEGGAFSEFLAERRELLPEDEQILASSWELVHRSVHEVIEVEPGASVLLRDLGTGDEARIRERIGSRHMAPGMLLCGRVVPDGEGHQLLAGSFPVQPGTESSLLDVLEEEDPEAIAEWYGRASAPPRMSTREGESMVWCRVTLDLGGHAEEEVVDALDGTYEREDDQHLWHELHPLNEDESILRASLAIEDGQLVVDTNSEERAERVLEMVRVLLPEVRVISDEREPVDAASFLERSASKGAGGLGAPRGGALASGGAIGGSRGQEAMPDELRKVAEEYRDRAEERWCDEEIPALGGLTPREAAADPIARESLVRLIASFPEEVGDFIAMRPQRLRDLLGL